MTGLLRIKNRLIAKAATAFPGIGRMLNAMYRPAEQQGVPWTPVIKRLGKSIVAVVTTAGVHRKDQQPFDMNDPDGDPSARPIERSVSTGDLMITHDYYDHKDADRDINIVFPLDRLRELEQEGIIKALSPVHFGLMGHVIGRHIGTLIKETAPEIVKRLRAAGADIVLLTPA